MVHFLIFVAYYAAFVMEKVAEKKQSAQKFSKEQYLSWYETMLLMRRFEERAQQAYIQQKIRGFCHLYIGQEAVAAGSVSAIRKDDNIITAYRDHAHPIAKGLEPKYVMAELFAKATGCSKGKGGSMHIFDVKNRFFWRTWHCRRTDTFRSRTCFC